MAYFNALENTDGEILTQKRILLLFPHIIIAGGALNYALKLAEFLVGKGATVGILALRTDAAQFKLPAGVEILSLEGPLTSSLNYWAFLPFWQSRINKKIDAWSPDVLIPQVFPANWWGWLYKRSHPDIKLAWTCQEPSAFIHSLSWIKALTPFWKSWMARALQPLLARVDIHLSRCTDRIMANSLYTAHMVKKIYDRDADAVVYPGFERELFLPGSSELRKGIVTVARLTRFKRIDFLLRVFALLSIKYPDLVFNIVGRGEDESALKNLARDLGVGARVLFHGSIDNQSLATLYQSSMLFLHGSVEEPFGMALVEAIACGTPVVAHKSGGPLEIVDDSCGRLIDSRSEEQWSNEIIIYIETLEGNSAYLEQVHLRAQKFIWGSTLEPAVTVIKDLLGTGSGECQKSSGVT
ncbi:MAG: glycosyltransferase family 4 protein [Desulfuromonadaceae bacterium]